MYRGRQQLCNKRDLFGHNAEMNNKGILLLLLLLILTPVRLWRATMPIPSCRR